LYENPLITKKWKDGNGPVLFLQDETGRWRQAVNMSSLMQVDNTWKDTRYNRDSGKYDTVMRPAEWRLNYRFRDTLQLEGSYDTRRMDGARYDVALRSLSDGTLYYMMVQHFLDALLDYGKEKGKLDAVFTFSKQGYTIHLIVAPEQ
jgi:hypothetical protein